MPSPSGISGETAGRVGYGSIYVSGQSDDNSMKASPRLTLELATYSAWVSCCFQRHNLKMELILRYIARGTHVSDGKSIANDNDKSAYTHR